MIIKNGLVVLPDGVRKCDIECGRGRIARLTERSDQTRGAFDAEGLYVCPGFVDIHVHGGGGGDFMDGSREAFDVARRFHASQGVTSILPTSLTAPIELINDFFDGVRAEMRRDAADEGIARVLGAHAEGPFLSKRNRGAQPEGCLLVPARDGYGFLLEARDVLRTVTVSPELEGAREMTRALVEAGIRVCGGHDDGRRETIVPTIEAGLSHATHLWCAMSLAAMYEGVRQPGLCEIALSDERLTAEIIADNHHMPPELVKIAYKCKGADKLCVVSDCLRAGGMPADGRLWPLGPVAERLTEFIVSGGVARLADGTRLAGSIQPVSQMVKNLVADCGIALHEAVKMASLTPARIVGAEEYVGSIDLGKCADFCMLDGGLNVVAAFIGGVRVR